MYFDDALLRGRPQDDYDHMISHFRITLLSKCALTLMLSIASIATRSQPPGVEGPASGTCCVGPGLANRPGVRACFIP